MHSLLIECVLNTDKIIRMIVIIIVLIIKYNNHKHNTNMKMIAMLILQKLMVKTWLLGET